MSATVTWHEAQKACNDHGGHLPTISSVDENRFVFNMHKSYCSSSQKYALLGFHDFVKEQHFRWVDDTTSCYTNWKSGEPNNYGAGEEDCALLYIRSAPYQWNDGNCHGKYGSCFLCEDSKYMLCVTITVSQNGCHCFVAPSCPHGWTPFGGKCFRHIYHATALSWYDARWKCRALGADLVSINCAADEQFLNSFMTGLGWYYVGYTDTASEDSFRWTDDSKSTYTHWNQGEPNNSGGREDCTAAHVDGGWNDIPCTSKWRHHFVCEM